MLYNASSHEVTQQTFSDGSSLFGSESWDDFWLRFRFVDLALSFIVIRYLGLTPFALDTNTHLQSLILALTREGRMDQSGGTLF